jgi:hypothetical protein
MLCAVPVTGVQVLAALGRAPAQTAVKPTTRRDARLHSATAAAARRKQVRVLLLYVCVR